MRAVSCYLAGVDFAALDIDREPAPETGDGAGPDVNVPALRVNWEVIGALAGILADKQRISTDEARAIIEDAQRFFPLSEGDNA
jgi:hypothetical protein